MQNLEVDLQHKKPCSHSKSFLKDSDTAKLDYCEANNLLNEKFHSYSTKFYKTKNICLLNIKYANTKLSFIRFQMKLDRLGSDLMNAILNNRINELRT